jgi:two-component system, NtrC family, sensor kinase
MTIHINFSSFRFKIIVTLILVVMVASFTSFYIYNFTLSKKIYAHAEKDITSFLYFFRDQIISFHDGRTIKPSLQELAKSRTVINAILIDSVDQIVYPANVKLTAKDSADLSGLSSMKEDITLKTYQIGRNHYTRAFVRFNNGPTCYACHSPNTKILGYVLMDFSLHESESTLLYTRNFSLFFTLLMLGLIISFVMYMHFRFIKKSLANFKSTIKVINDGNLSGRVHIPESKELGDLGKNFNTMVENFQRAQFELQKYHRQEIQDKQKLASIGEMSARLAHEIRNPITGIANAVEIIIDESNDESHKPILEEIQRQANRVNKAISNLLNYSRTKELNLQEGDVNEIIKSVVFFLKSQANQKVINFRAELDETLPAFRFDSEQLENVLLNLGMNAVHSVSDQGEILYKTHYDSLNKLAYISVKDTGHGIPEDKIPVIFNPFFTMKTEGTGLGLAIAKEIVEMHRGEIRVTNNEDQGCTFHISLPLDLND